MSKPDYLTSPWLWNGQPFTTDKIGNSVGFVYLIEHIPSGKKYVGCKVFHFVRKPRGGGRRRRIESDWQKYWGSCDELKSDVKLFGAKEFRRTIISLHGSIGDLHLGEVKELFRRDVLERDDYYNSNVLGKYFKPAEKFVKARQFNQLICEGSLANEAHEKAHQVQPAG